MTGNPFLLPRSLNRRATKQLSDEIAEKIAEDKEHDHPCCVFEPIVHAKQTEVEENYGKLITKQGKKIEDRGYEIPLIWKVSMVNTGGEGF